MHIELDKLGSEAVAVSYELFCQLEAVVIDVLDRTSDDAIQTLSIIFISLSFLLSKGILP
jgi:hypothetical protein